MDTKDTISVLNDLIKTSKDGEKGFIECADDLKTTGLKSVMMKRSQECAAATAELQQLVLSLGGEPENDTSLGGDLHRRWVGLKGLVTGKDDTAILNECERGEDIAKKNYNEALEKDFPPQHPCGCGETVSGRIAQPRSGQGIARRCAGGVTKQTIPARKSQRHSRKRTFIGLARTDCRSRGMSTCGTTASDRSDSSDVEDAARITP